MASTLIRHIVLRSAAKILALPPHFLLRLKVTASEVTESGVKLTMEPSKGGASTTIEADVVLVATGRRPYTANLGCDELGISLDKIGRIEVDSHFRTAVPSVYAIGDCIAGPMLAHKAEEEGIACVENIAGFAGHVNYDAIPGVVYTYPEVAEVRPILGRDVEVLCVARGTMFFISTMMSFNSTGIFYYIVI